MSATNQGLSEATVREMIVQRGWVPNIGQITPQVQRALERSVRRGELAKYRGYWDTGFPHFGIGPLKTIYATPEVAAVATGAIYDVAA